MLDALLIAIQGLVPPMALGQTQQKTGTIEGTVTTEDGESLPGVSVILDNADANFEKTVMTNVRGEFRGVLLPFGSYRVTASLLGFNTVVRDGVQLSASHDTEVLRLVLKVAQDEE